MRPRKGPRPTQQSAGRPRLALFLVIAASVVFRLVYFIQLNATPLIALDRWDQTDMHYYESWARTIADGDWLSRTIAVPMHGWQQEIAGEYFGSHPEERAALEQEAARVQPASDAATLLWTKWLGAHRFYQDPLYPYLIGLTYRVIGRDVRYVFAWQLAAGVLSNVLIFVLARRFFGETVGACAGVMAVLCAPLMYYDLLLLRESLIILTGLGIVWLTDRAWTGAAARSRWFAVGFSIGVACLLKSNFALFGLMIAAATVWHFRGQVRSLTIPVFAAAAGLILALTPLAGRNLALGLPVLDLASAGPLTFIASNVAGFPVETGFAIDTPRVAKLMGDTYGHPAAAIALTLQSHTPGSFAAMLWKKWKYTWIWFEIPNNEDFYYTRLLAPVLGLLPITFWLVGSLGLVGLALSLWDVKSSTFDVRSSKSLLYALVVSTVIPLIVFYVIGRFRAPLLAALMPFAAVTIVQVTRWVSAGNYRSLIPTVACAAALLFWTGRAASITQPLIRPADWLSPFVVKYEAEVQRALDADNPAGAAAAYLAFFQYEPDVGQIVAAGSRNLAVDLGRMHQSCADLLRQSGQPDAARVQDAQAAALLRLGGA